MIAPNMTSVRILTRLPPFSNHGHGPTVMIEDENVDQKRRDDGGAQVAAPSV